MTFSIPTNKIKKIKYQARKLASRDKATPREIAKFLGYLNYLAQAIVPERLRTRALYTLKDKSLQMGDWDTPIPITNEVQEELRFWMGEFIMHNGKPLIPPEPAMESASDASKVGYGAYCYQTKMQLAGVWSPEEAAHSSNWRELEDWLHHTDNTPTVAYINKQGGPIKELSEIARRLWLWAIARNISITAAHLPGIQNTGPDKLSRMGASWKEWMIQPTIFKMLNQQYGPFEIDLFASTMNYQLPTWVSLTKMLGASAVDAFSLRWTSPLLENRSLRIARFWMFPPFNQILRTVAKINREGTKGVLVTPDWPAAPWFPILSQMNLLSIELGKAMIPPRNSQAKAHKDPPNMRAWILL
eukprot:TRINITY_DN8600_c0_g1_i2.p2 TRINITY_DN8600_c0_g1~~TRINITY_DN8600_c0_g1_i2.p2  ORF type:complete len:358 (-),score=35.48 TRINITY_DN8600_c0_g1_i2:897-1970(-)